MKHKFIGIAQLIAVASLAVAIGSCSKESAPQSISSSSEKEIGFTAYAPALSSKATVVDNNTMLTLGFNVEVYLANTTTQYFESTELKYDTESGVWQYDISRYWPSTSDRHLTFFAYYPSVEAVASETDFKFDYTVESSTENYYDLIYALREDVECPEESPYSVELPFRHALTQVGFKAKNSLGVDVKVYGIEIHNLKYSGTFTVSEDTSTDDDNRGVWALDDDIDFFSAVMSSDGVTVSSSDDTTPVQLSDTDNVMILMPQTFSPWVPSECSIADNDLGAKGAYLKISCDIDGAGEGDIYVPIGSADSEGDELWGAGYIVTYLLTFGTGYDEDGKPI